eukprot:2769715-Pyramimonas_sp.AAC.2
MLLGQRVLVSTTIEAHAAATGSTRKHVWREVRVPWQATRSREGSGFGVRGSGFGYRVSGFGFPGFPGYPGFRDSGFRFPGFPGFARDCDDYSISMKSHPVQDRLDSGSGDLDLYNLVTCQPVRVQDLLRKHTLVVQSVASAARTHRALATPDDGSRIFSSLRRRRRRQLDPFHQSEDLVDTYGKQSPVSQSNFVNERDLKILRGCTSSARASILLWKVHIIVSSNTGTHDLPWLCLADQAGG